MNDRNTPGTPHRSDTDTDDDRLRSQLRALQPPVANVDALSARVLAQWSERQSQSVSSRQDAVGAASTLGLRTGRRRLWAGLTTGLLACGVVAAVVWLQRPDPSIDELIQADVLSQMAIGEM